MGRLRRRCATVPEDEAEKHGGEDAAMPPVMQTNPEFPFSNPLKHTGVAVAKPAP